MSNKNNLGVLTICGDRRFRRPQEDKFSQTTGLSPQDFWVHSLAGGAGRAFDDNNLELENYAINHGATIMGWGMHGNYCGGYPGLDDKALKEKLEEVIKKAKKNVSRGHPLWSLVRRRTPKPKKRPSGK